jgi:hypothetical protein
MRLVEIPCWYNAYNGSAEVLSSGGFKVTDNALSTVDALYYDRMRSRLRNAVAALAISI